MATSSDNGKQVELINDNEKRIRPSVCYLCKTPLRSTRITIKYCNVCGKVKEGDVAQLMEARRQREYTDNLIKELRRLIGSLNCALTEVSGDSI